MKKIYKAPTFMTVISQCKETDTRKKTKSLQSDTDAKKEIKLDDMKETNQKGGATFLSIPKK